MRRIRTLLTARIVASSLLFSAFVATVAGCGEGKIARYPVKGAVRVDGKPVTGALVIFCPIAGPPELKKERPFGRTDDQGVYELRTLEPGDGAPAGDYQIMVRWVGDQGLDRLRDRYTNPEQSGLSYTVVEGANDVPPFELSTR